jgi:uncharacterized protein (TIRG00374 family)
LKSVLKFLIFLGVGLTLLYFVYTNQAAAYELECQCNTGAPCTRTLLEKIMQDFTGTNPLWLFAILMAFMISNLSRALRWNQLIEPLGYQPKTFNTFFATMIGYMVNLALPRAGEIAKPATVTQYEKIPLEKLVGTIVVDRTFDVLMLLIVTGITFLTQFTYLYNFLFGEAQPEVVCLHPIVEQTDAFVIPWLLLFQIGVVLGLVVVAVVALRWKAIKETALAQKVLNLIKSFGTGVQTVFKLKRPGLFVVHTLVIWIMYYLMMYLCFFAYAPTERLSPMAALLAFTFGTFGMVIPSPGGMGTYQVAVTAALVVYGVAESDAFAFSNIMFFTITLFGNLFFGLLAYLVLPIYNKGYEPTLPTDRS